MKDKIIELLKSTERQGIDGLIKYMEDNGFFTAPCSGGFHLCKEGGLAEHSLNVFYKMLDVATSLGFIYPSITLSALLHDLGKASYHGKPNYVPNILTSGKVSTAKPYEINKEILISDHAYKSCMIASKFIELTEEEEFAIKYHNGLYEKSGYEILGKERPLQQLLLFADFWCSRFVEVEK